MNEFVSTIVIVRYKRNGSQGIQIDRKRATV